MARLFIRTGVVCRWNGQFGAGRLTPFDGPATDRLELWCRDFRGSEQGLLFLDDNWQKCLAGARVLFVIEEGCSQVLAWAFDSEQNRLALERWLDKREKSARPEPEVLSHKPAQRLTGQDLANQLRHGLGRNPEPPKRRQPRLQIARGQ